MTDPAPPRAPDTLRLLQHLRKSGDLAAERQRVNARELEPRLALLKTWQSARLARTHRDLLDSKRYGPATRFFVTDIYAARDFSQRDQDVKQMHRILLRFLPEHTLHALAQAIELNEMSHRLDAALAEAVFDRLGATDTITPELYAAGYRECDNYVERVKQIERIVEVGRGVDQVVRLPMIGTTLRVARGPIHRAGLGELHDFLERGYAAFSTMHGGDWFLDTIYQREMGILDRIFSAHPDPFGQNDER